jgi:5-formyltetrahydrofolate cyclo-ligase
MSQPNSDKKSLRAAALKARDAIDPEYAKMAGPEVAKHLLQCIPTLAKVIGGYYAMRSEINIGEAMVLLAQRGHVLCLPVIVKDNAPLAFRTWKPGGALEKGMYGTEIPLAMQPPQIPDAVIVPLVAFDKAGHRLGYGAGFYDQTICRLREQQKDVMIVGVGFAAQQIGHIPSEPHDQRLDAVVTEKGVVQF